MPLSDSEAGVSFAPANRKEWQTYIAAALVLDLLSAIGALSLSYYVRFQAEPGLFHPSDLTLDRYLLLAPVVLAWIVAGRICGLYDREKLLAGTDEYSGVLHAATYVLLGVIVADFLMETYLVSRGWLVVFWFSLSALAGLSRFVLRRAAHAARRKGAFRDRVLIAGLDDESIELARHLSVADFDVVGFLDDFRPLGSPVADARWRVLGTASDLGKASQLQVDEVIVVPSAISWESRQALCDLSTRREFRVRILPAYEGAMTAGLKVSRRAFVPMYAFEPARVTGMEAAFKRVFDIFIALSLLLTLAPFALARLVSSLKKGHAPFERREFLGLNGEKITAYTLAGCESRVISKLPALLAVLLGQMSIVGPKPLALGAEPVSRELRLMKPGLTSAVPAPERSTDDKSGIAIQIDYVRNYSIWRDLQIAWHRLRAARQSPSSKPLLKGSQKRAIGSAAELWR